MFRSCADVRIVASGYQKTRQPASSSKPNFKKERQINPNPMFIFYHWQEGVSGPLEENTNPDLNKLTGLLKSRLFFKLNSAITFLL